MSEEKESAPKRRLVERVRDARTRHRERHRPSGLGLCIADRIDFLPGDVWDALTATESFFLSRVALRAIESELPAELEPRYALVFRGSRPVAAVVAQLLRLPASHLVRKPNSGPGRSQKATPAGDEGDDAGVAARESRDGGVESQRGEEARQDAVAGRVLRRVLEPVARKVKDRAGRAKARALGRLRERVLVCGNVLTWGSHGVAIAAGEDPAEIWRGIAEALYRIRRSERLAGKTDFVLVKDLDEERARGASALERFSYTALETEPNMILELADEVRDYEGYLASLNSRYRKAARRIDKEVTSAGISVERIEDLAGDADAIHALYLAVHDEARVRLVTVSPGYLPALARAAGEAFRTTVLRREGALVGFVTTLRDHDEAIGYLIGFDRTINGTVPIYFRLLQAVVADALDLGCRRVSLGRTALEPKARLGARPETQTVFVRHRVPILNAVVRRVLRGIEHDEPPERSPFR